MGKDKVSRALSKFRKSKPSQSAVEYGVDCVKRLILDGDLNPGDKLPSENDLTHILGVSRSSLREAKKILSVLGVVEMKPGDGTYITDSIDSTALDALLLSFAISIPSLREIYDLRKIIEASVIGMAISNASDAQIVELEASVQQMQKIAARKEAGATKMGHLDVAFHHLLGHITGNRLLEKIYSYIINYLEPSIIESHKKQNEMASYAIKSHLLIVEVLRNRDANRIEEVTNTTIDIWYNLVEDKYALKS